MAKILVVDDQPSNRDYLTTLLGYGGHQLLEAADGGEALKIARAERPDLIITDILMPTMDGYELVRRLRSDDVIGDTPTIFYSATYLEIEMRALARLSNVQYVLTKPAEPETVLNTVSLALGGAAPAIPAPLVEDYDREHVRILTDKLTEKVAELDRANLRLATLIELIRQLASELDPVPLLREVPRVARELIGARYAAVGVLDAEGQRLRHYFISGVNEETRAQIGVPPARGGLLDTVITEHRTIRERDLNGQLQALELPPAHPHLHSLLCAPLASGAAIYGWLYLGDKLGLPEFTLEDERIALSLAAQVAVAYENARRHEQIQQKARELEAEVNARQQVQETLSANEKRFRALVENSFDAIALFGADGAILYGSPSTTQVLGYAIEEFEGRNAFELIHPDDRAFVTDRLMESLEQPGARIYVYARVLHKNGSWRWLEGIFTNLLGEPNIHAIVNNYHDFTERKLAEDTLRASEERYRTLFESNPNPMWVYDLATLSFLAINDAAIQHYGYSRDEFLAMTIKDIRPPEDIPVLLENIRETRAALDSSVHWRHRKKDGTLIDVEITSHEVVWLGRPARLVLIEDVTERKRAEALLRQSEERFSKAFHASPSAMAITRLPDGKYIDVNLSYADILGYRREELLGRSSVELNIYAEPTRRAEILQLLCERGSLYDYELVVRGKSGELRDVVISFEPIELEGQGCILAILDDITERKRTEERQQFLAKASNTLASSLDYETTLERVAQLSVPRIADWCTIYLVAEDGTLEQVALAHVDPEKVAWAREFQRRYHPDPNATSGVVQVVRSGQSQFIPEITDETFAALIRDPELFQILRELELKSSMMVPLMIHGRTLGALSFVSTQSGRRYTLDDLELAEELARRAAVAVDNARLYREAQRLNAELEERVRERTVQLEAANKELEAFSYSVSHDLRAPLRAIDGFSRILMRDSAAELSPKAERHLQLIRSNTQQMGQLVDDLLTFSRLGRQPLKKQSIVVSDLVRQVLDELQVEHSGRQIDWNIGELGTCEGDPALLKQVWLNLISNAVKYTSRQECARIQVGVMDREGKHIFFVSDNGAGFDMKYAHKLFGVFQRLHRAEDYEGTGVGLAIVQRVVTRHGGRVWAEGAVDQGAAFYFTLGA